MTFKLGVAYNVFDGEELLLSSIQAIKKFVSYIVVVAQATSNHGEPCNKSLAPYLVYLKLQGWIDEIVFYEPKIAENSDATCHANELEKRKIGRCKCIDNGCSHFLSMDCDEFYKPEDFKRAIRKIEKNKYDSTACKIQDYYKKPEYQIKGLANYYVPFIQSVSCELRLNAPFFTYVDPTRGTYNYYNPYTFRDDEIVLNHMTAVRLDLVKKYRNSSARINFGNNCEEMALKIQSYDIMKDNNPQCQEVKDIFNINKNMEDYKINWLERFK